MARGRTKKTCSDSKGGAKDKVMMIPETDFEIIAEEIQDVASSNAEDSRSFHTTLMTVNNYLIFHLKLTCLRK